MTNGHIFTISSLLPRSDSLPSFLITETINTCWDGSCFATTLAALYLTCQGPLLFVLVAMHEACAAQNVFTSLWYDLLDHLYLIYDGRCGSRRGHCVNFHHLTLWCCNCYIFAIERWAYVSRRLSSRCLLSLIILLSRYLLHHTLAAADTVILRWRAQSAWLCFIIECWRWWTLRHLKCVVRWSWAPVAPLSNRRTNLRSWNRLSESLGEISTLLWNYWNSHSVWIHWKDTLLHLSTFGPFMISLNWRVAVAVLF